MFPVTRENAIFFYLPPPSWWTNSFINGDHQEFENMFIRKSSSETDEVFLRLESDIKMYGSQKQAQIFQQNFGRTFIWYFMQIQCLLSSPIVTSCLTVENSWWTFHKVPHKHSQVLPVYAVCYTNIIFYLCEQWEEHELQVIWTQWTHVLHLTVLDSVDLLVPNDSLH